MTTGITAIKVGNLDTAFEIQAVERKGDTTRSFDPIEKLPSHTLMDWQRKIAHELSELRCRVKLLETHRSEGHPKEENRPSTIKLSVLNSEPDGFDLTVLDHADSTWERTANKMPSLLSSQLELGDETEKVTPGEKVPDEVGKLNSLQMILPSLNTVSGAICDNVQLPQNKPKQLIFWQVIWLLLCAGGFAVYGSLKFLEAQTAINSKFKPRKLISSELLSKTEDYEMPYFFILFEVQGTLSAEAVTTDSTDDDSSSREPKTRRDQGSPEEESFFYGNYGDGYIRSEIESLFNISYFNFSYDFGCNEYCNLTSYPDEDLFRFSLVTSTCTYRQTSEVFEITEVHWNFLSRDEFSYVGYIRLLMQDPEPKSGFFTCDLSINTFALNQVSVDNHQLSVDNFEFLISRKGAPTMQFAGLSLNDDLRNAFYYSYEEVVIEAYDPTQSRSQFLGESSGVEDPLSPDHVTIIIDPGVYIETWEEYCEYDYWAWIATVGGTLTIVGMVFYFFAKRLTAHVQKVNYDFGILANLNLSFESIQKINELEEKVNLMLPEMEEKYLLALKKHTQYDLSRDV